MPPSQQPLAFDTQFEPETGKAIEVAPGIVRVTAPNASAYTFTGTNSFILGGEQIAVVDPGPDDDRHLDALLSAIGGRSVAAILLTHTHRDHSALAPKLAARTGAPLWFEGPHRLSRPLRRFEINRLHRAGDWALKPGRRLLDGDIIAFGSLKIEIVATPGHCANHIALGIVDTPGVLTGDHVMGWNSTLVATPDGSMTDYFASLERLIRTPYTRYIPAHGGPIANGRDYALGLRAHREKRNEQILAALKSGEQALGALRKTIYPDLPPANRPAARMTLEAHLEYLEAQGKLIARGTLFGRRFALKLKDQ